jgi:hypothetical protein
VNPVSGCTARSVGAGVLRSPSGYPTKWSRSSITPSPSEVPVGPDNGLEHESVVSLDNVVTIPASLLGRTVGFLNSDQEALLARAVVLAYDLNIALLDAEDSTQRSGRAPAFPRQPCLTPSRGSDESPPS